MPNDRRPNRSGSLSESADRQTISVRITLPDGRRRKRLVHRDKGEAIRDQRKRAEAVLDVMLAELAAGRTVPGTVSLADFASRWMDSIVGERAESTLAHYRRVFAYYLKPYLGTRPVSSITYEDVEILDGRLLKLGKLHTTRRHARRLLSMILTYAKKKGLVATVVTGLADPLRGAPRDEKIEMSRKRAEKALDAAQLGVLLVAARSERLEALITLLAFTGMRRGEALGLGWDVVKLEEGTVTISRSLTMITAPSETSRLVLGEPKTTDSIRTLNLHPQAVASLKAWRTTQASERLALGSLYMGSMTDLQGKETPLVFTDEAGRPVKPDALRSILNRVAKAAHLGSLHPHQLRHSAASVLIALGHSVTTAAGVLGHADPSITASVYAHSFEAQKKRATGDIGDAILGTSQAAVGWSS